MQYKNLQKNKNGFVILFAATISAIILAITLGVTNIALKEVKFGTNARDTNNAFFAADTGVECALVNDRSTSDIFTSTSTADTISCVDLSIPLTKTIVNLNSVWGFTVPSLGSSNQSCATVTVEKDFSLGTTSIISKGYNDGDASCVQGSNSVERELKVTYGGTGIDSPPPPPAVVNSATFLGIDDTHQGSWQGVYGASSYDIFGASASGYPPFITATFSGDSFLSWEDPTEDGRGLYKSSETIERIAAARFSETEFTLDVNITDGNSHQTAIYMMDWDESRSATIEVLDGDTYEILDAQSLYSYGFGRYVVWNISGHVVFRFINTGGSSVVAGGVFFD